MNVKKCTVCNKTIDEDKYRKDRNICKFCYNIDRKKYNSNTFSRNNKKKIKVVNSVINTNNNEKKRKVVDSVINNNNRTLIIGFSNCGETYLMNHFLLQKQQPIFLITKSLNQYPNIEAQTSDEIQPLEHYKNSIFLVDEMLLSKQESNIDLFLPKVVTIKLIFTKYLKVIFTSQKVLSVIVLKYIFCLNKL